MEPALADRPRLKYFADYIERELGIVYEESNYYQLQRRIEEIARMLGLRGAEDLYARAHPRVDSELRELLLDVATNNETSFFRDPNTFRALEEAIVPALASELEGRPLRIWSAAASTGQEAYSIALTLEQMRSRDPLAPDYRIVGTDISERVLKRAQEGVYTQLEVQRGLPTRTLLQAFEKVGAASWAIRPDFRRAVEFRKLNLLSAWPGLPVFDLAFLRNVLIYLSPANRADIVRRVHDQLAPGGVLVLGGTESLLGIPHAFSQETLGGVVVYRKRTG